MFKSSLHATEASQIRWFHSRDRDVDAFGSEYAEILDLLSLRQAMYGAMLFRYVSELYMLLKRYALTRLAM